MKRAISALLAVIMILSAAVLPVYGEEVQTMAVTVDSVSGYLGQTAEVNISVVNNPGVSSMSFEVYYDEQNLTLESIKYNTNLGGQTISSETMRSPVMLQWVNGFENWTEDGVFATLYFRVPDDAALNVSTDIHLTYDPDNIYNVAEECVPVTIRDGRIDIKPLAGDINGDGKVNNRDITRLFQYLANWNVTVNRHVLDVNGDGKVNNRDITRLMQYLANWAVEIFYDTAHTHAYTDFVCADETNHKRTCKCGDVETEAHIWDGGIAGEDRVTYTCTVCGGTKTEEVAQHTHTMTLVAAKEATCTEDGSIAYAYCEACGKYFADADGSEEITLAATVIPAAGHRYADVWSSDENYHWHAAVCEHSEAVGDKSLHAFDTAGFCTVCGFNKNAKTKLGTPVITSVEYDRVYWEPVEYADTYTVRVNDNYECTLRGTSCSLADVLWNGKQIAVPGYVRVQVFANGYGNYSDSDKSAVDASYCYVPPVTSSDVRFLKELSVGYGYNLIEEEYFNSAKCSKNSIFDVGKLLTIGDYVPLKNMKGAGSSINYQTMDEFLSKTKVSVEYENEVGCMLIGSIKKKIATDLGFNYKDYKYTNTYVYQYDVRYKDHRITNLDKKLLKYCLSEQFEKAVKRESSDTYGLSDNELMQYLFDTYGTHAILGVTTGGTFFAESVVSTNEKDIAASVNVDFGMSTGGGAIDKVIQKNFNVDVGLSEDVSWKKSDSEAHFTTHYVGGKGAGTVSADGVDSAIKTWTGSFDEETAVGVELTKNGAISIGTLIAYFDGGLAKKYEAYVDKMADDTYREIAAAYTSTADIPTSVTAVDGENVLCIDLSGFGDNEALENAYHPNYLEDKFTVYPVMYGKNIDKVVVKGGYNAADKPEMLRLTFKLAKGWTRPIEICFENCGLVCETGKDPVDTSAVSNSAEKVKVTYKGYTVVQDKTGTVYVHATVNDEAFDYRLTLAADEALLVGSAGVDGERVYLPIAAKDGYDFGGWYDENGSPATDAEGLVDKSYVSKTDNPIFTAKWNNHIVQVELDNCSANASALGSERYYEQYGNGAYADYACTQKISGIAPPEKTGYVFGGYYKSVIDNAAENARGEDRIIDETGAVVGLLDIKDVDIKEVTLYALWTPAVYTVEADTDGGSRMDAFYVKYKVGIFKDEGCTTALARITPPTKAEAIFGGFRLGDAEVIGTDGKVSDVLLGITDNVTVKAVWTNVYTVTLDHAGAAQAQIDKFYTADFKAFYRDILCTEPLASIAKPMKSRHLFEGYYAGETLVIDSEGNLTSAVQSLPQTNVTLTARWKQNVFDATLNLNSGGLLDNAAASGTYTGNNLTVTYDASARVYTLKNSAASDPYATIGQRVRLEKNTEYTIHMYLGDAPQGTNGVQLFYAIDGAFSEAQSVRFNTGKTTATVKAPESGVYQLRIDNDTGKTITVRDFWIQKSETVTETVAMTSGKSNSTVKVPTRLYYAFDGYYDAPSGGNCYFDANGKGCRAYDKAANVTLYAHWRKSDAYADYTYIATGAEFCNIAKKLGGKYLLVNDIDMRSVSSTWKPYYTFSGILDGQGHTIANYSYSSDDLSTAAKKKCDDNSDIYCYGLFGYNKGTVKNLTLQNCNMKVGNESGKNNKDIHQLIVGLVCGYNDSQGKLQVITVKDSALGAHVGNKDENQGYTLWAGYLCGDNKGTIEGTSAAWCHVRNCNMYVKSWQHFNTVGNATTYAGGITGANWGTVRYCETQGNTIHGSGYGSSYVLFTGWGRAILRTGGVVGIAEAKSVADYVMGTKNTLESSVGSAKEWERYTGSVCGLVKKGATVSHYEGDSHNDSDEGKKYGPIGKTE